jgi:hypothetical protein
MSTGKVTAQIVLDCNYSGSALAELKDHFPDWDRLSSEQNRNMHTLVFVIDESKCSAFYNHYKGLGRHRGELTFLRPLRTKFEAPVAA